MLSGGGERMPEAEHVAGCRAHGRAPFDVAAIKRKLRRRRPAITCRNELIIGTSSSRDAVVIWTLM